MRTRLWTIGLCSLVLTMGILFQSCSGKGASENDSYAGPGSDWDVTIGTDGTFNFIENDANWNLSGTWVPQIGAFKKFTVNSSNTGSVTVGSEATGLDIPGIAFLLKPIGGTSQVVTMVNRGNCPTQDGTMNWIITRYYGAGAGNPSTSDLFGVFQLDATSNTASLPFKYQLDGSEFTDGQSNLGSFNCTNGEATLSNSAGAKMYLSDAGALVNTGNQYIIGFLKSQIGSTFNMAGTYYGLLFKQSTNTTSTVEGVLSGSSLNIKGINTETGTYTGSNNATLNVSGVDTPKDGFIKMTIGSDTVRCMGNPDLNFTGKKLIFCAAKDPDGSSTDLYNLLLITE